MRRIEIAMRRFNVGVLDVAQAINCTEKTVRNKLSGVTDFTYSEVKTIRNTLFDGMNIEYLFDESPTKQDYVS